MRQQQDTQPLLARDRLTVHYAQSVDAERSHTTHSEPEFGGPTNRAQLEKRLLRKIDSRLSILMLIYILNYIDRNNAAAARLRGFEADLNLTSSQFATILSVLYVGYLIMQVPSNMFLAHCGRPSVYLPMCMVLEGIMSIATETDPWTLNNSFGGAVVTRFLLGFVEAAFYPGALLLISRWYTRAELSQRTAILGSGALISNAFGSLIASGILDAMQGALGYAAWRWLFFIEGGLTVVVACISIFVLPDFPETTSWLTAEEKALAIRRVEADVGFQGKDDIAVSQLEGFRLAFRDGKVWWLAMTLTSLVFSLSFNAYFPTLMSTLGNTPSVTMLICVPPWIFAAFVAILLSRHSDHHSERFWHVFFAFSLGIVGNIIAMSTMDPIARYISLFLQAQSYAGFICFVAWASSSVAHPPAKRAVALAWINTVSSLGNVFGSHIFPTTWGPSYVKSFAWCTLATCLGLGMSWVFKEHLIVLNKDAATREAATGEPEGYRYMI
ncbi:MFS general substrate transporter [Cylindrobasidium torrendii FP15055 ss-10]|uniref:MFS general substrate transporter n=1 Tax=Cylindrobasidium torrendii FP15055 ss-10 TaxID=1314674 RepID=A0A0D7BU88_9AGAR|nr:MFS general substrate transporter [Cylindrobasidium torrendii FP15055 ss-10]